MSLIDLVRKMINPLKLDLKIYPNLDLRRRQKLLKHYKIDKVLDVGANSGQYATQLFQIGYKGKIISFEPVKQVFSVLQKKASQKKNWTVFNYGFGNKTEECIINISKNTYSSSLLDIMPSHIKGAPESEYISKEKVQIKTIDTVYSELIKDKDVVLLKIDVQGFEKNVLDGAKKSLGKIKGIQLEMSIEELYKGEMLFVDMARFLKEHNFNLQSLENGFFDNESGKLLQVDGIFFKE